MFRNVVFKPERTTFEVHGLDLAIVNALRRTILTDIPTIGFRGEEDPSLDVIKNTGPLHNEFILHRFGLIPIHFNEEITESFQDDDYEFELDVENKDSIRKAVTTRDIKVRKQGRDMTAKELQALFPPNPITKDYIVITYLRAGEHLHIKGKAVLGTAREHAGFSPVSLCTQYPIQDPVLAAKASNILDKERAFLRNEYGDPTTFQFEIETETGLSAKYLIGKALEVLRAKLDKTVVELYAEPSEYVTVEPNDQGNGFNFTFQKEDDTYGFLLQSLFYNHYIREKKPTAKGKEVTYVGYYCPHPLEQTMVVNMVIKESSSPSEYVEAFAEQCRRIAGELQQIHAEWLRIDKE